MTKSHELFLEEINILHPTIQVLGRYSRAVDRIKVKCINCGNIWEPKAYSLTQGKGCPHCSAIKGARNSTGPTRLKTHEEFCLELKSISPNIVMENEYKGNKTPIDCLCKRCGHRWTSKAYSLLQGHGCPRCIKSGTSFMEQFILQSMRAVFGEERVLSRDRKMIGMELDIFIPSINLAIEPGNWQLHKRHFKRDCDKRAKCKEHGVRLITIYDKYPESTPPPFDSDCYIYKDDLNKTDHETIRRLVQDILSSVDKSCTISEEEWNSIESLAYENSLARTHEKFVEEMARIDSTIDVIGTYRNSGVRIRVRCKNCGFEWMGVPANLLRGDGCRKCGTKKAHEQALKDQIVFEDEMRLVNPTIEIIGKYNGRHQPVKAKCRICGYEWSPVASSLLRGSSHKGAKSIHNSHNNN